MRYFSIILGSALAGVPVQAQELPHIKTQSGSDMVEACRAVADGVLPPSGHEFRTGVCFGEIEALTWLAPGLAGDAIRSCVPESIDQQQIAKVVADYLAQNSVRLREPFEALALEALSEAWPCPSRPVSWFRRLLSRLKPAD